jgi:uncharacterized membrane protein
MNKSIRNLLMVLFTTGLLVGFAILAMDFLLASHSSAALELTSQNSQQAQIVTQSISGQMAAGEGSSTSSDVVTLASKMGVVALIIMLVFFTQMGIAWMLRKPAQVVRW